MIWHILRKDLRLLWVTAGLVAAVNLLNGALLAYGGPYARMLGMMMASSWGWITNLVLPFVGLTGLVLLVISVVQTDRLPGTTQDWLTRPIPRGQLFAAKLLFILLLGLAPILVADIGMGLTAGFSPSEVLLESLTRSATLLCLVCIPAALVGAVTASLMETVVFALGAGALLVLEMIGVGRWRGGFTLQGTGLAWIAEPALIVLSLVALAVILPLTLRWRRDRRLRSLLLLGTALIPLVMSVPWSTAFRMQRALDSAPDPALTITVDGSRHLGYASLHLPGTPFAVRGSSDTVIVTLPVLVSALEPDEQVYVDRIAYRVAGSGGSERFRAESLLGADDGEEAGMSQGGQRLVMRVDETGPATLDPTQRAASIAVRLPASVFAAARSAKARIELEVYATSFRPAASHRMASLDQGFVAANLRCAPRQVNEAVGRALFCESTQDLPTCFDVRVAPRESTAGRSLFSECNPGSYEPRPLPLWRDAYQAGFLGGYGILDKRGPLHPDEAGGIVIDSFAPAAHFVRRLAFEPGAATERAAPDHAKSVDGAGLQAGFAVPADVVADRHGNLFLVDVDESVVRRVSASGEVSTLAGAAQQSGYVDGAGAAARFDRPSGLSIDAQDNLYVADTGNGVIRKLTPQGLVSTVTGPVYPGQAAASALRFKRPTKVVVGIDGSLYVVSYLKGNEGRLEAVLQRIAPDGVVSIVAGSGTTEQEKRGLP